MSKDSSKTMTPISQQQPEDDEASVSTNAKSLHKKYGPISAIAVTVGAFFASQLLVGLLLGLLPILLGDNTLDVKELIEASVQIQFLITFAVEALMLWTIWQFMKKRGISPKSIGLVGPEIKVISYAIIGYVAYFILFFMMTLVTKLIFPELNLNQEQEIGFNRSTAGADLLYVFASLVILPPIAEEIICRGFLYTGLRNKLSPIIAAIITSIIFAAAHLQWGSGNALLWAAALDTFVLSMILVYLRQKTQSLWSPILVHMIKNSLAFSIIFVFHL